LDECEGELACEPKPELFTKLCFENVAAIALGLIALKISMVLSRKWADCWPNRWLVAASIKAEPAVSLLMGLFTGCLLIKCAAERVFCVPNMVVGSNIPDWLLPLEATIGAGLVLGICARASAAALLFLLAISFRFFSANDCVDLLPMWGIAAYFLLAGRNKWSIDQLLGLTKHAHPILMDAGYLALRWATGLGLAYLGLDEKLANPQFALHLIQQMPMLNFMRSFGMSDAIFVLCAGVTEVLVGLTLALGTFPRLSILILSGLFVGTTCIFGQQELYGHMPYYGVIIAILLRGGANAYAPGPLSVQRLSGRLLQAFAWAKPKPVASALGFAKNEAASAVEAKI